MILYIHKNLICVSEKDEGRGEVAQTSTALCCSGTEHSILQQLLQTRPVEACDPGIEGYSRQVCPLA